MAMPTQPARGEAVRYVELGVAYPPEACTSCVCSRHAIRHLLVKVTLPVSCGSLMVALGIKRQAGPGEPDVTSSGGRDYPQWPECLGVAEARFMGKTEVVVGSTEAGSLNG